MGIADSCGQYTNLGLLISDECEHTIYVTVCNGNTQSNIKKRVEFSGSLLQQFYEVNAFLQEVICESYIIKGSKLMIQENYSEIVIQEALLNLIVHRDYSDNAFTNIIVYSDRIEFVSNGGLVKDISLNDVLEGVSVCRNPKLVNIFLHLGLVSAYGLGLQKIMMAYLMSEKKPKVQVVGNTFKLTLPNLNTIEMAKSRELIPYKERCNIAIAYAECKDFFKRSELENFLGLSSTTCIRLIDKMIDENILTKKRRNTNTVYCLNTQK